MNLNAISLNDFVANAVFFVIDVILLSILVPILLARHDNHKWSLARRKIGERSALYLERLHRLQSDFADEMEDQCETVLEEFDENPDVWTADGARALGKALFSAFLKGIDQVFETDAECADQYLQEMQLLSPASTSELAIYVASFYESLTEYREVFRDHLRLWHLAGPDRPSMIAVRRDLCDEYLSKTEILLEQLCKTAGLKPVRANDGDLMVSCKEKSSSKLETLIYGYERVTALSLQRVSRALSEPLLARKGPNLDHVR